MFSGFLERMKDRAAQVCGKYYQTIANLNEYISMHPRDITKRSVRTGNWATALVTAIIYPVLLYYRGLDIELLSGMLVHLVIFWGMIVSLVWGIQFFWIFSFFITQRFGPLKSLDFEILDKILGPDDPADYFDSDYDESDDAEMTRAFG